MLLRTPRQRFKIAVIAAVALVSLPGEVAMAGSGHDGHGSPRTTVESRAGRPFEEAFPRWYGSDDFAVVGSPGPDGYRLAVAREREQFVTRPLATIQPGGYAEDDWLGYQCVTGDRQHVVVTLMPRRAINKPAARDRGGLLYSVRISDGTVRPLLWGVAMKQHGVNCGTGALAAAVRHLDTDQRRSELLLVDAATGQTRSAGTVDAQLTWPVPVDKHTVLAVRGRSVLSSDLHTGRRATVATFDGPPTSMAASRLGADLLVEKPGGTTITAYNLRGQALRELGSGPFRQVRLLRVASGQNLLFGIAESAPAASDGARRAAGLESASTASRPEPVIASVRGGLVLAAAPEQRQGWSRYTVDGGELVAGDVSRPGPTGTTATALPLSPGGRGGSGERVAANTTNPTCGVPRNDPRRQAFGPGNVQVQWAVEMASKNRLFGANARPANHLQSGLPAYSPSSDFAIPTLLGQPGRVPPVVMNGILAQENNYAHASRRSLPGSGGNPAISDYYGSGGGLDLIDYDNADCGYGIAQVTSGMKLSDTSVTPNGKAKVAIDYAENIQAGMQILAQKWNQLYSAGIRMNNSDPSIVEDWYFAIWAYNTGVQPDALRGNTSGCTPSPTCHDGRGNWGLGWSNNPMNPDYPAQRPFFLRDTYADAEHPSDWPYQERVFGWMATPIHVGNGDPAYPAVAPLTGGPVVSRLGVPARTMFCSIVVNDCDPGSAAGCLEADFHCWWNQPIDWPLDCATACHVSQWTFADTAGEPSAANPWPPTCNSTLGSNAVIVDELPDPAYNLFCPSRNWSNQGTFSYTTGSLGQIDFHQLATGFGAHTWFAGNRLANDPAHLVQGTWTPSNLTPGIYSVRAHIPMAGGTASGATYKITLADGYVRHVAVDQHNSNSWKTLGNFQLGQNAKVELDNVTRDTPGGTSTVAFDAVAFVPVTTGSFACPGDYISQETKPGVKWCVDGFFDLIAVDLTAGAKLRVVSDHVDGSGNGGDAQFYRRQADDWADYILDGEGPLVPAPERLTHVVNAGFSVFDDDDSTPLSLPEVYTEGQVATTGYAEAHQSDPQPDPAWAFAPKLSLSLTNPSAPGQQQARVALFGDSSTGAYTGPQVYSHFSGYYDGTVAFNPTTAPSDANVQRNRTFLCSTFDWTTGHAMVYILTNNDLFTGVTLAEMNAEANSIGCIAGRTIQFDGGRSSQMYSVGQNYLKAGTGPLVRHVPEVFAIYSATP